MCSIKNSVICLKYTGVLCFFYLIILLRIFTALMDVHVQPVGHAASSYL